MVKVNKVRKILINSFHEQKWDSREKKEGYNFDTEFGLLMTSTTREKIYILLIKIFKALFRDDKQYVLDNMPRLLKMIKIHTFQLYKLKAECINENIIYFREAIRAVYNELRGL